jgi:CBS domain-containing protein
MTVASLCNHNVVTIAADADIRSAAMRLRESHVGCIVVTEHRDGHPVPIGVLTDRDLVVEVLAQDVDADRLTVADIMSRDILTIHEDNGIEFALKEMGRVGVRRAPIINSEHALVGLLSIDDVVEQISSLLGHMAAALGTEQRIEERRRP